MILSYKFTLQVMLFDWLTLASLETAKSPVHWFEEASQSTVYDFTSLKVINEIVQHFVPSTWYQVEHC